ncbi:metal-dependent hydrolase [archaeon]|jgi:membrane-bound metal-dependent hydrolase YbcI (DUF457 family)|nr:metal-dependent hydrolase [archaeon]
MLFRTHITFGLFVYLLFFSYFQQPILTLVGFLIGVIIVDLDSKNSKIGKRWYFRPIQWFTKHRKIFHTAFFGIIITSIIATASIEIGVGFFFGFTSHLILDSLTIRGIAPLHPFTQKKISGYIRSGGIAEDVLFVFFLISDIALVFVNLIYLT